MKRHKLLLAMTYMSGIKLLTRAVLIIVGVRTTVFVLVLGILFGLWAFSVAGPTRALWVH